jgi:hypothetical protein
LKEAGVSEKLRLHGHKVRGIWGELRGAGVSEKLRLHGHKVRGIWENLEEQVLARS